MSGLPKPDFVLVGGQVGDGRVCLMASRTLRDVEFRYEAEIDDSYTRHPYGRSFLTGHRYTITAEMKDMVQVVADSYPEAFRALFDEWAPSGPAQIEGQRAIE